MKITGLFGLFLFGARSGLSLAMHTQQVPSGLSQPDSAISIVGRWQIVSVYIIKDGINDEGADWASQTTDPAHCWTFSADGTFEKAIYSDSLVTGTWMKERDSVFIDFSAIDYDYKIIAESANRLDLSTTILAGRVELIFYLMRLE